MKDDNLYYSDLFKKIANNQKNMLNNSMSDHGITYVQALVLLYLLKINKQFGSDYNVSQKDVEKYLSLKGSTVTHIINRMEDNGYLVRIKSEKDSRTNYLFPTENGIAAVSVFFSVLSDLESLITKGMTADEKMQLNILLRKVLTNFEAKKE